MGKWSKMMKSGLYGPHFHGHGGHHGHRGHHNWHEGPRHHEWNDDSSSSSDSSERFGHKHPKKHMKKHMKRMCKLRHFMKDLNMGNDTSVAGDNDNKAICSLCCHQIKPLVETEILECGHIYHRFCLEQLFNLSARQEANKVLCTKCKSQISEQLVDALQARFATRSPIQEENGGQQSRMNTEA